MVFNRKAAFAASVATICIVTGTVSLAQGIKAPQARYVAIAGLAGPTAAS